MRTINIVAIILIIIGILFILISIGWYYGQTVVAPATKVWTAGMSGSLVAGVFIIIIGILLFFLGPESSGLAAVDKTSAYVACLDSCRNKK